MVCYKASARTSGHCLKPSSARLKCCGLHARRLLLFDLVCEVAVTRSRAQLGLVCVGTRANSRLHGWTHRVAAVMYTRLYNTIGAIVYNTVTNLVSSRPPIVARVACLLLRVRLLSARFTQHCGPLMP